MHALRLIAVSATLLASQAYAATAPNTLTATPNGHDTGRQVLSTPAKATAATTNPGLTVKPTITTIKSITAPTSAVMVKGGAPASVSVIQSGLGDPKNPHCVSSVKINSLGSSNFVVHEVGSMVTSSSPNGWTKTQTFLIKHTGKYEVRLEVSGGNPAACGYTGPGSIPGDLSEIVASK